MQAWEVLIALGHMGRGKSREERRYLMAPDAVAARNIAFSWGAVKGVLLVQPCTDAQYIAAGERGLTIVASESVMGRVNTA
ncbi:MAG: hypothetical protein M0021_09910 [Clostridia bacterium]|nr:hypothetical protein [Clostridia bacterium]